jgi:hypothetical protein
MTARATTIINPARSMATNLRPPGWIAADWTANSACYSRARTATVSRIRLISASPALVAITAKAPKRSDLRTRSMVYCSSAILAPVA